MRLIAEFNTDEDGKPLSISDGAAEHFSISLKLADVPAEVQRVKYVLDPTYHKPVRTVPARIPGFEESITSYGDFEVTVEFEENGKTKKLTRMLSSALEDGSKSSESPAVQTAISQIKKL